MTKHIPDEIWTQHVAILAKPGRGKTITAKGGAASLMKQRLRVGAVDPTAAWWGMQLTADGKKPAFPMVIFGGDHANIPIDPTRKHEARDKGEKIGALLGDADFSWIIDTSGMGKDYRTDFMTGWAEAIFAKNRRRLNLFMDECHLYIPQQKSPGKAARHMLDACNNIVAGGRGRGFCVTMISQRPAKVHKDSLTATESMITLGMLAPQDIKAVRDWVTVQGSTDEAREMLKSLPSLPVGGGWVYAPALNLLKRMKFPMIDTFDSSRAPGVGEEIHAPQELAQIDLEAIRAQLAPSGRKTAKTDKSSPPPAKSAAELAAPSRLISPEEAKRELAAEYRRGHGEGSLQAVDAIERPLGELVSQIEATVQKAGALLAQDVGKIVTKQMAAIRKSVLGLKPTKSGNTPMALPAPTRAAVEPVRAAARNYGGERLPKAEAAILGVLAHYPAGASRNKVAIIAGYSPSGGGFGNALSALRTKGLLEPGEPLRATAAGLEAAGDAPPPLTGDDLLAYWLRHSALGKAEREILKAAVDALPESLSREDIAARTGYAPDGGGFGNALSRLRTLELISGSKDIQAAEEFA